ncbi:MAG: DUF1570 domain-containing protein [Planctomycetaceae bacterium]
MPAGSDNRKSHSGSLKSRWGDLLRALTLVVLLVPGCASSRAHLANGLPARHQVRSHQVLLLSDEAIPAEDEILEELGAIRERVTQELGVPPGEREVVVYLFADRERYAAYMRKHHPDLPARRAFFIGTPKELAVYAHWGEHVLVDLRHEYTHGLLHAAVGNVPIWLDEGIAEYFEVGRDTPGSVNPEHLGRLVQATQHGWRPDLQRLEQLEQVDDMQREDYQEAWAWVHYLLNEDPAGPQLISGYLNELRRGQVPVDISQRLGMQLPSTQSQLAQYVSQIGAGAIAPVTYRSSSEHHEH